MKTANIRFGTCFLLLIVFITVQLRPAIAQATTGDTLVRIHGTVINEQTENPVKASITYEKLPYGDDMGIAISNAQEGSYQMYMVKNGSYLVKVKADGYITHEQEMAVTTLSDDGTLELNFVLKPTAENEVISLENLLFKQGSAQILPSSYDELNTLAKLLDERPAMIIQLEGHTDFEGNAQANYNLSMDRVEAVKDYLTKAGIKKKRVLLKAFGGELPITRERTPEAKRMNRRVEVRVIKK